MKSLFVIFILIHQCFTQEATINCSFLRTRVVYDFRSSIEYSCMVLRQSIDPNATSFKIIGEHTGNLNDGSVRGILITDSQVPFISKALMDAFFDKFKLITHIEVFHSRVERIEPEAFTKGTEVKAMSIVFNRLKKIEDFAFDGLKKLVFLRIVNSRVEEISENAFRHLEKLESLSLKYNYVKEFPKKLFWAMEKLGMVDISNNDLTRIDGDIFYNSNDLQDIYMSYNRINAVGENVLAGMHILNSFWAYNNDCISGYYKYREESMRALSKCFENYGDFTDLTQ
jgi:Leucine-rich repeat (LRR) protein